MDASDLGVSDHSHPDCNGNIKLHERVKNGESQVEAPLFFL